MFFYCMTFSNFWLKIHWQLYPICWKKRGRLYSSTKQRELWKKNGLKYILKWNSYLYLGILWKYSCMRALKCTFKKDFNPFAEWSPWWPASNFFSAGHHIQGYISTRFIFIVCMYISYFLHSTILYWFWYQNQLIIYHNYLSIFGKMENIKQIKVWTSFQMNLWALFSSRLDRRI